ncbi:MAG: hypothetical protein ACD_15C00125G0012 [uncultured bacterium]|nr:MAG: hypothetical protein ACD_15C00125G0012 [uncultured bacterium]HCU70632.1 hypothetical protein [Candidatus Moranbacteria bacterium]
MKKLEIKLNLNYKDLYAKIAGFVVHKSSIVLLFIGILFLGYCIHVWYQNVYSYEWDEVKKQDYMNNKNAGTNLNRVKFEKVLEDIERRKGEYEKNMDDAEDFFRLRAKNANEESVAKDDDMKGDEKKVR